MWQLLTKHIQKTKCQLFEIPEPRGHVPVLLDRIPEGLDGQLSYPVQYLISFWVLTVCLGSSFNVFHRRLFKTPFFELCKSKVSQFEFTVNSQYIVRLQVSMPSDFVSK